MMQFRASSPRGLGELLARELDAFGATEVRERSTGVRFCGTLETAYRACLWSRTANRVFLELAQFQALDADTFYAAARHIDWVSHIAPEPLWRATLRDSIPHLCIRISLP